MEFLFEGNAKLAGFYIVTLQVLRGFLSVLPKLPYKSI
jgi:hypothetical protein